jgi:NAD dependent epimerase/dehydratase family enzyme
VLGSRVDGTTAVATAVARAERTRVLLSASAVGYYGDTGDRLTDETGPNGEGFLAETCRSGGRDGAATAAGKRVALLRTASCSGRAVAR